MGGDDVDGGPTPVPSRKPVHPPALTSDNATMTVALSPMKLLDDMYNSSSSEVDKGTRFERFVQSFLQTDPVWAEQFSTVWMWEDWPEKTGHDTGIDLVAERRDGGLTAIQCKFYKPDRHISKGDIDSFLSKSGRIGFTERIIVSTTTKWGPNAEDAIRDQAVPVRRLGLDDFEQSRVDWASFNPSTPTVLSSPRVRTCARTSAPRSTT